MLADRVLAAVDTLADEAVAFTSDLIRMPTVNPPGDLLRGVRALHRRHAGARAGSTSSITRPKGSPSTPAPIRASTSSAPGAAARSRPLVHLNGHFDVVPAGAGWTVDPFGGEVRDGRIWGRGSCDMKAGIAAAVFAAEAIRRAGVELNGSVEISGTVDEESGGFAGVAWLAHTAA